MTDPFDPYATLGVERTASDEEIKAAFRREAAAAHPDREGGSTERMTDVNMAYKILSDPESRAQYDRTGGTSSKVAVEEKAKTVLINMLQTVLRASTAQMNMIGLMRDAVLSQRLGCQQAREKTKGDLNALRERLRRLKGPPENFIETVILSEIKKCEELLPVFDADEEVFGKALELLGQFSYDLSFFMTAGLLGNQGNASGASPFAVLPNWSPY